MWTVIFQEETAKDFWLWLLKCLMNILGTVGQTKSEVEQTLVVNYLSNIT